MHFRSNLGRLFALVFVLLSFSMLISAAPAPVSPSNDLAVRGGCTSGCNPNVDPVDVLVKLKAKIAIQLNLLDGCYNDGTDPAPVIANIAALINAAVAILLTVPQGVIGLLSGKVLVLVNLVVSIIISIATHCAKWSDKAGYDAFLTLCIVIDVALKTLLGAVGGLLGVILGLVAGLLGGLNLALLVKVKFFLCIGILGL